MSLEEGYSGHAQLASSRRALPGRCQQPPCGSRPGCRLCAACAGIDKGVYTEATQAGGAGAQPLSAPLMWGWGSLQDVGDGEPPSGR